jgi:hypothetical protein
MCKENLFKSLFCGKADGNGYEPTRTVWPERPDREPWRASQAGAEAYGHFDRIDRVVAGCARDEQLESARNMVDNFRLRFPESTDLHAVLLNRVRDRSRAMRWEGRKAYMLSLGFEYSDHWEYNFRLEGVWSCPRGQVEDPTDEEFEEYMSQVKEAIARESGNGVPESQ